MRLWRPGSYGVGTVAVGYAIAVEIADDELLDEEQREEMSGFLDSLPVRVPVELIRWDPFYLTTHQIVARVDESRGPNRCNAI